MKRLIILLVFLTTNLEAEILLREHKGNYCYDGDTCYVEIDGKIRDEKGNLLKIRLLELDTPEISKPKCEDEKRLGLLAKEFINELIRKSVSIELKTDFKKDRYGRILSYLVIDGEDVSSQIINNNLGVLYERNNKKDWCS
tara:strand:+ start:773 stop:1195 length:423 start_codon:yes stop_codon:yes gene_type:complete